MQFWFSICRRVLIAGLMAFLCSLSSPAFGQLNATQGSVSIQATLPESLTISASPASLAFNLLPGKVYTTPTPVVITTAWTLSAARSSLLVYSSFASGTNALTDGGSNTVLASQVSALNSGANGTPTTYTPISTMLKLFSLPNLTAANRAGTHTDSLLLQVDLSSSPQLPAATYSGTLTIQAQAN